MAYNAQSTGHYAQYRDANNIASMEDIIFYRNKNILPYFKKKLIELIASTGENSFNHSITSLDKALPSLFSSRNFSVSNKCQKSHLIFLERDLFLFF